MQGPGDFQRTVFEVNEWVMPAGTSQEFTIIAIGAEASATVVRGHYERLECCSMDLPPQPNPALLSANQGLAGCKRSLCDVAHEMNVDAVGNEHGREEEPGSWARKALHGCCASWRGNLDAFVGRGFRVGVQNCIVSGRTSRSEQVPLEAYRLYASSGT